MDLLPVAALALDHRLDKLSLAAIQSMIHRVEDDSESECGDLVGQLALPGVVEFNHSLMFHLSQNRRRRQQWRGG